MKTIIILFFITLSSYSQIIKDFPLDKDGKIAFSEVIEIENVSKENLYFKVKSFFVDTFKSANSVIQLDDKEVGTIIGKGNSKILINAGMGVILSVRLNYTIKIQCKDNKIKYDIYNLYYTTDYGDIQPDAWLDEKVYYKKNGKPRSINEQYKDKTLESINELQILIRSIKNNNDSEEKW